ncbi:MAG: radical SAM protein [Deltaproteobacteria bacterium]|nr:radical SAM protein [Deltaproteobacteria bacterium]
MRCTICERGCVLAPGKTGACGLYENQNGKIVERFPDRYLVTYPISIETMPILHYHPGGKYLQVSTTGCNFNCPGCISTVIVREMPQSSRALRHLAPAEVVAMAEKQDCLGIVFLMNDPLASLPTFLRLAALAKSKGLKVGCASNGYFTAEALAQTMPLLDFITIGIKGLTDAAYRACGAPNAEPVWRNLRALHAGGVHVEAACILRRDNQDEIRELADRVAELSPDLPLLVMRFIPLEGADISLEPTIREAEAFCAALRTRLPYVYLFNSPGTRLLDTVCANCGRTVYERDFYGPMGAKLRTPARCLPVDNRCPNCGQTLPIESCPPRTAFQEKDFEGGYPFTRALEMVEAMLIALGVERTADLVRAWEVTILGDGLQRLHHDLQTPRGYIGLLRHFGAATGREKRADLLAAYMEKRLSQVEEAVASAIHRPRVCYVMGKPLFCINGRRMENELVQTAGGHSVNREIPGEGRPGQTLSADQLQTLRPEVMFVSAFLSSPVEDLLTECLELDLDIPAVRNRRIHDFPAPGWDFGSPRWILGLMHIANSLHPECCSFDIPAEAETFHQCFYGTPFVAADVNRSFGKPTSNWRWKETATTSPLS